jgi:hypothetical protein
LVNGHLLEVQQTTQNDEALAKFLGGRNQADWQDPIEILQSFVLPTAQNDAAVMQSGRA